MANIVINNNASLLQSDELAGELSLPHFAVLGQLKMFAPEKNHDLLSPSLTASHEIRSPAAK